MLFQSVDRVGERLSGRPLTRRVVLAMIKRRAATAGLPPSTCCHTFRATGITAYLSNGGTLEHAQQIAGHASPKDDEALRPDGRHGDGRRNRTHRDLNESAQRPLSARNALWSSRAALRAIPAAGVPGSAAARGGSGRFYVASADAGVGWCRECGVERESVKPGE